MRALPDVALQQTQKDADGRRLSRAVGTEEAEDLAFTEREVEPIESLVVSDSGGIGLAECVDR